MKINSFLLVAGIMLALAFTFSCTSGGDEGGNSPSSPTYGSLPYEGQTYKTVIIGSQTWMAENLNYDVSGSKCYDNNSANCSIYGRLYDWATAMALDVNCNSSENGTCLRMRSTLICD